MSPIGIVPLYALCCYVCWHKSIFALVARCNRRALCLCSAVRFSILFSCPSSLCIVVLSYILVHFAELNSKWRSRMSKKTSVALPIVSRAKGKSVSEKEGKKKDRNTTQKKKHTEICSRSSRAQCLRQLIGLSIVSIHTPAHIAAPLAIATPPRRHARGALTVISSRAGLWWCVRRSHFQLATRP